MSNGKVLRIQQLNPYHNLTDNELVLDLIEGNELAFQEIYERYSLPIYRYIYSRIRKQEDSEEIIQEIFLWLWQKRATLSHIDLLKPYLYSAARHKIVNYIAHCAQREKYADHYRQHFTENVDTLNEQIDVSDFYSILEKSIVGLPKNCQTAFRLSRIEHLPIAAIAERMNLSTGTVENYIGQALKHLRATWGNHYQSE